MGKDAGGGCDFAVGVVLVGGDGGAAGVYQVGHVTLEVGDVVVDSAVVLQRVESAVGIKEEVNGIRAPGRPPQTVAAHGQGSSNASGHDVQAAIGRIVGAQSSVLGKHERNWQRLIARNWYSGKDGSFAASPKIISLGVCYPGILGNLADSCYSGEPSFGFIIGR